MSYVELQVTTNFSFLNGASHPEEIIEKAIELGYEKIAITDRNTLAGIVRAHIASRDTSINLIPACRLDLLDGPSLLVYPTNKQAYSQLCELLSIGNLRTEKGQCHLYKSDVYDYHKGMKLIALPPDKLNEEFQFDSDLEIQLLEYKNVFGPDLYLAAHRTYQGDDHKRLFRISELSNKLTIPMVATNDVHYHEQSRRELQDILTCVREKCTIYTAGYKLHQNAERHLKPIDEMHRIFNKYPDAVRRTIEIAEACNFSLSELKYYYPEELTTEGRTPQEELEYLSWKGAEQFFGNPLPDNIRKDILKELQFIAKKNYASYFLTVYDIVHFARKQNILCQGRGSAANSTVCFCLGITSVNPQKFQLLFERFISDARNEPPDIDVDFEHERREEVIQYIYNKYGRDRAAIVATVTQQRYKSAIRDVGKAMGLSLDIINRLSSSIWHFSEEHLDKKHLIEQGLNPEDPQLLKVLKLTQQMVSFPRQLGQHTGGFIITQNKLTDLCPVINARMTGRTNIEWNKDDIEALGFLKVDVLALGMLTCIRKCFDLLKKYYDLDLNLATIPQDDPAVYEMISRADTIGVFQVESRAQQTMLPRLKPKEFYDLVIEVAIVRPGPIQGDMVHPYLRRRNNEEKVEYPSPELKKILERTLGVPLFQEQAMQIAIEAAGFSPHEADELRRSMATFKAKGKVSYFKNKLIEGMILKGYKEDFANRIFKQLEGFGSYGFPESHAVSFALLVYVSSWFKCHYPDIFATALLNSMPMGFYQPAQIVIDARKHEVEVRPVDVNFSLWDNTLEEKTNKYYAIRLGFRQVKGLSSSDLGPLISSDKSRFDSISSLRNAGIQEAVLEKLADADAFGSLGLNRRQALWEIAALHDRPIALFRNTPGTNHMEAQISLPLMSDFEQVAHDYASTALSLKAHPVYFAREKLRLLHVSSATELKLMPDGVNVKVAGLVIVRQRPATAAGVCFITIEDETGFSNLVVFEKLFDNYRKELLQAKLLMVEGKLQREGEVIHVILKRCFDASKLLSSMNIHEKVSSPPGLKNSIDEQSVGSRTDKRVFPKARNFK